MTINICDYLGRYDTDLRRTPLAGLVRMAAQTDLDPEYQRGHVCTAHQQWLYLGALLDGRANDAAAIVLYERDDWSRDLVYEVIDGKQRLTAITRFFTGAISVEFRDGFRVSCSALDVTSRRKVGMCTVAVGIASGLTRAEIIDLYLALNEGGTAHAPEELARVRALQSEVGS